VRIDVGCTLIGRFELFEVLGVRQSEAAGVFGVGGPPEVEAEESELERLDDQGCCRKLEIGVVRYYDENSLRRRHLTSRRPYPVERANKDMHEPLHSSCCATAELLPPLTGICEWSPFNIRTSS
jgi:hypothetical protein